MNKYFLFLLLLQSFNLAYTSLEEANKIMASILSLSHTDKRSQRKEGFAATTLIKQSNKVIAIQDLQNDDLILGAYDNDQKIVLIENLYVSIWYEIELDNGLVL